MDEHLNRIIKRQGFYSTPADAVSRANLHDPGYEHFCPLCGGVTRRGGANVCVECARFVRLAIERGRAEDAVMADQTENAVMGDQDADAVMDNQAKDVVPEDFWGRFVFEIRRHQGITATAVAKRKERVCPVCGNICYLSKGEICSYCRALVFSGITAEQLRRKHG